MTCSSHIPRRVVCAVGLLFCTLFATPTWASVIYEYREEGSSTVIGTLEIASPPASPTSGWSTVDPADFLALHLDDTVFDLGAGNLLSLPGTLLSGASALSLSGPNLDVGGLDVDLPAILPVDQLEPTADPFLSLMFDVPGGADFIGLLTLLSFPAGGLQTQRVALFGDWTASPVTAVPEPGTAALVLMGLAAGRLARRRRR